MDRSSHTFDLQGLAQSLSGKDNSDNEFLFKTDYYFKKFFNNQEFSSSWILNTINRQCSANYQMQLFLKNPIFGNKITLPTEDALNISGCTEDTIYRYCEACVLGTYWLSKGGIAGIVLIIIYIYVLVLAMYKKNVFGVASLTAFGIFLQGWGVLFVPYNFTFLILISLISLTIRPTAMLGKN